MGNSRSIADLTSPDPSRHPATSSRTVTVEASMSPAGEFRHRRTEGSDCIDVDVCRQCFQVEQR